ncbi:hypothetical protein [Paenibacillus lentus]|uniref:Uncharacterized protein n=1 Tax=Paenibacillus lentus TaxID=1338368 RepID=A0A3S8RYP5_9BACL|nr:hypothetical protein [Paenibacillus lentus]AZK48050.1 hypothetical protein EIM92_19310 [Paenibacillus lentus]
MTKLLPAFDRIPLSDIAIGFSTSTCMPAAENRLPSGHVFILYYPFKGDADIRETHNLLLNPPKIKDHSDFFDMHLLS